MPYSMMHSSCSTLSLLCWQSTIAMHPFWNRLVHEQDVVHKNFTSLSCRARLSFSLVKSLIQNVFCCLPECSIIAGGTVSEHSCSEWRCVLVLLWVSTSWFAHSCLACHFFASNLHNDPSTSVHRLHFQSIWLSGCVEMLHAL